MASGVYIRTKDSHKKGKSFEILYGEEKAKEIKKELKHANLGRNHSKLNF